MVSNVICSCWGIYSTCSSSSISMRIRGWRFYIKRWWSPLFLRLRLGSSEFQRQTIDSNPRLFASDLMRYVLREWRQNRKVLQLATFWQPDNLPIPLPATRIERIRDVWNRCSSGNFGTQWHAGGSWCYLLDSGSCGIHRFAIIWVTSPFGFLVLDRSGIGIVRETMWLETLLGLIVGDTSGSGQTWNFYLFTSAIEISTIFHVDEVLPRYGTLPLPLQCALLLPLVHGVLSVLADLTPAISAGKNSLRSSKLFDSNWREYQDDNILSMHMKTKEHMQYYTNVSADDAFFVLNVVGFHF